MSPTPLRLAMNTVAMIADEHERRADHRVQEELRGGVDAALVAPAADEEVHRHEHDLEEDEEQEQVEAEERAHHAGLEQQQPREVRLVLAGSCCAGRRRGWRREQQPVSTTRNSEMPSTPRCQRDAPLPRSTACLETNWKPASARSNSPAARRDSAPVATDCDQPRRACTSSGRRFDSSATSTAPTAGTSDQHREDRERRRLRGHQQHPAPDDEPAEQQHDADAEDAGVVAHVAASGPCAATPARTAHELAGTVDGAVDDRLVEPGDGLERLAAGPAHERGDGRSRSASRRRGSPARRPCAPCLHVDAIRRRRCRPARSAMATQREQLLVVVRVGAGDVGLARLDHRVAASARACCQSSGIHAERRQLDQPRRRSTARPARPAGTASTRGDSCGLNSPWAPCSSACDSHAPRRRTP